LPAGESFDLLLGRRTYDIWSGFWPKAPGSPLADGLNAATKYVAPHRPESLE
jgi:dihydrofolate reductase